MSASSATSPARSRGLGVAAGSTAPRRTGIGLVLGAGGTTGAAFHAGTLLALQQDLGWDPNTADVIVGSSAGTCWLTPASTRLSFCRRCRERRERCGTTDPIISCGRCSVDG